MVRQVVRTVRHFFAYPPPPESTVVEIIDSLTVYVLGALACIIKWTDNSGLKFVKNKYYCMSKKSGQFLYRVDHKIWTRFLNIGYTRPGYTVLQLKRGRRYYMRNNFISRTFLSYFRIFYFFFNYKGTEGSLRKSTKNYFGEKSPF